jgi:hypothetical protein
LAAKAVTGNPKNADYRDTLGTARYRAGDWKGAIGDLEQALRLRKADDSANSSAGFFLAMAYWQVGDKAKAREWFDKSVARMDQGNQKDHADLKRLPGRRTLPSASEEARGRPVMATVVFDLPPRADFTPILSSATSPGQGTIGSVTRGVGQRWEEVSVPSAIVVDPRLASVHEEAPGSMAALWPDPGPLQWSWPNPDLFPQQAGLAR